MAPPPETAAQLLRNAHQSLPEGGLAAKLKTAEQEGRPLRVKLGLDPTAPDIHLGHTVVLGKLREFQDLGHKVVLIIGDYTARVGDPSGRSATRPVLSGEQIDANARTYQEQAFRVLLDDPERLEVRFNSEWLDMRMEELFRLARTTTVAQLLERDDFAKRWSARAPSSGGRTRPSTCSSRATSSARTASPSRRSSRCRCCRASTGSRRCPSRSTT